MFYHLAFVLLQTDFEQVIAEQLKVIKEGYTFIRNLTIYMYINSHKLQLMP